MIARAPATYDPAEIVADYIDGVQSGRIVAGRYVKLAVQRHLNDLKDADKRGWVFSEFHARAACRFIANNLQFTKGEFAGRPFIPSQSQTFILWCLYGWRHKRSVDHAGKVYEPGYRRFKTCYITCSRGWGKSEFAAAISLRHLIADDPIESGARVYCVATKAAQAREAVWMQARNMVQTPGSPLEKRVSCFQHHLSVPIGQPQPLSFMAYIGSNSNTADSKDATLMCVDELHAWGERHAELFAKISTSGKSRRQSLTLVITTAGTTKSTLWLAKDKLWCGQLERAVLQDIHDGDHVFVFAAKMDEARACDCAGNDEDCHQCGGSGRIPEDDIFDEANWPKSMPNLPVTPNIDEARAVAKDAKHDRMAYATFRRFYANLTTSATERPIAAAVWARCAGTLSDWKTANIVGIGCDLGAKNDLASIGLCARFDRDRVEGDSKDRFRYELRSLNWLPQNAERDIAAEPWASWIASGLIRTCPGSDVIIDDIEEAAYAAYKTHRAHGFRFDPHQALQMAQHLEAKGCVVISQTQGYKDYNEPLIEFIRLVKAGLITYDAATEPVLTWAMSNFTVKKKSYGQEWMPDKDSSPEKIDPAVAVLMAFAEAMYAPTKKKSTYKAGSLSL